MKTGDGNEAATLFEAATRLRPDDAEPWANLSVALRSIGQDERSRQCESRAASLQPSSPAAPNALPKTRFDQGGSADAAKSQPRGLSSAAPSVDMLLSYSHTLMANGLIDEALQQLDAALALDPNNLTVRWAIAIGQLKPVYESESDVLAARQAFGESLDDVKSWFENTQSVEAPYRTVGAVQPFYLTYQHYNNRDLLKKKYGALCATFMGTLPGVLQPERPFAGPVGPPAGRKLRLGVVSAHVREHSVWIAVTKGWVKNLDRASFDLHIFHLSSTVDPETEAATALVVHFDNRSKDVAGWAKAIVAQKLDVILYPEIASDPLTVQLASLRLAPVQAVTWGHPETSGLPTVDLFLSASAFEPPCAPENSYSERLVVLPNLSVCVEPLALPDVDPDLGRCTFPPTSLCYYVPVSPLNMRLNTTMFGFRLPRGCRSARCSASERWGGSFFFRSHDNISDRMLEKRLRAAFARQAVDFDAHVSIIPFLDHARFFGLMRRSALMLDTPGFSGFNTALQAVECDLPVLAFEGDFLRARLASGIMREIQMPELVATSAEDFVQKAIRLARHRTVLGKLRAKIIERRFPSSRNLTPVRALERLLIEAAANRL